MIPSDQRVVSLTPTAIKDWPPLTRSRQTFYEEVMVKMNVHYVGQLHCELTHEPSLTKIETDAPKDNQGKGESFSPTDLMGAALASCVLTTMGIAARRDGVSLDGARAEVIKEMSKEPPRRIVRLPVKVTLPDSIPGDYRAKLEQVGLHCPVHRSLHPEIDAPIEFSYGPVRLS